MTLLQDFTVEIMKTLCNHVESKCL